MDDLKKEMRKCLKKAFENNPPTWENYFKTFTILFEAYMPKILRDELIKFTQQFYADEETYIHNVDEYLKQK